MKVFKSNFIYNPLQLSDINSILVGALEFQEKGSTKYIPAFAICKVDCFLIVFNINGKTRTVAIMHQDIMSLNSFIYNKESKDILGYIPLNLDISTGLDFPHTNLLYEDSPSRLYALVDSNLKVCVPYGVGIFTFDVSYFGKNFKQVELINLNNLKLNLDKCLSFNISKYGAYALKMFLLGSAKAAAEKLNIIELADDCVCQAYQAKEQFANYLSNLENAEINVPTIRVVEQEAQKLLPACLEEEAVEILVKTDDQVQPKETVVNTNTNTNTKELDNMLNNNVTLTVQLTDVNNAPKNADGSNKTYSQAGRENNYRGWVMNYKPESNLITITGTLVTHTDLVCQVNGLKDKYRSIKADSLNNQTRVTFCVKAPKGYCFNKEDMNSFQLKFQKQYKSKHQEVSDNFDKQLNSFVRIDRASSFVYSAATEETNASLTCFLSFDDLNFFDGKYSLVKKLTSLTRVTKTIALS